VGIAANPFVCSHRGERGRVARGKGDDLQRADLLPTLDRHPWTLRAAILSAVARLLDLRRRRGELGKVGEQVRRPAVTIAPLSGTGNSSAPVRTVEFTDNDR
jgi:hypothetical protein